MLRRDFLKACLAATAVAPLMTPQTLFAANYQVPPVLWARRGKDILTIDYSTASGYQAAAWLLRDVRAGVVGRPNVQLLQLLSWMQAYLAAYGFHEMLNLHSGLRTPGTNNRTEGAARASKHLADQYGQFNAADFSTANIPSRYMGKLAQSSGQGGVGIYVADNFTHADIRSNPVLWTR